MVDEILKKQNNNNTDDSERPAHQNLWVCAHCLMAIEAHEGKQATLTHYIDDDDPTPCDWCEEADTDTLYELI